MLITYHYINVTVITHICSPALHFNHRLIQTVSFYWLPPADYIICLTSSTFSGNINSYFSCFEPISLFLLATSDPTCSLDLFPPNGWYGLQPLLLNLTVTRACWRVFTHWQGCTAWMIITAAPLANLSRKLMAPYTKAPLCCRDRHGRGCDDGPQ